MAHRAPLVNCRYRTLNVRLRHQCWTQASETEDTRTGTLPYFVLGSGSRSVSFVGDREPPFRVHHRMNISAFRVFASAAFVASIAACSASPTLTPAERRDIADSLARQVRAA